MIVKLDMSRGDACPSGWTRITTPGDIPKEGADQGMMLLVATLQSLLPIILLLTKSVVKLKVTKKERIKPFQ